MYVQRLCLRAVHPVLGGVGDLEVLLLALAGRRLVAACSLESVDRVDTSLRQVGVVGKVEPLDGSFALCALACCLGSILVRLLCYHGQGVGRCLGPVQRERWDLQREEVVSKPLVVALGHEIHVELPGSERGEGQCETRDGGDLPLREGIGIESRTNIVELG